MKCKSGFKRMSCNKLNLCLQNFFVEIVLTKVIIRLLIKNLNSSLKEYFGLKIQLIT